MESQEAPLRRRGTCLLWRASRPVVSILSAYLYHSVPVHCLGLGLSMIQLKRCRDLAGRIARVWCALLQTFSPRASLSTTSVIGAQPPAPAQTGAGPSIWGQMAEQDLQQSSTGVLIDPLFGPGIASAGLSPRSSIASMQALLAEPGGNMGSPARNSPMSQSFSHSQGGAGKVGRSHGSESTQ